MKVVWQVAAEVGCKIPHAGQVEAWVAAALEKIGRAADEAGELTVRVVDEAEMSELNRRYRDKPGPTNVLSFSSDGDGLPPECRENTLGDVVICAPVVAAEATANHTPPMQHWARMVVHGTLHLCGYDHQHDADARHMEAIERDILADLTA